MSTLALVFVLLSPALLGWGFLRLIGLGWRDDRMSFLAWSYLVGTVATSILLFAFLWTGLDPARFTPIPAVIGCALLVVVGRVRRGRDQENKEKQATTRGSALLVLAVLVAATTLSLVHIVEANTRAIVKNDEAQIWAAKAHAIYDSGGFGTEFSTLLSRGVMIRHKDYPLLNPLLQIWTLAHARSPVEFESRVPIQAFTIALLFLAAGALRARVSPWLTCLMLIALATTTAFHAGSATADADTMVAFGFLAALDALDRFLEHSDPRFAALGAAALAFLVWSKNEGWMLSVVVVAIAVVAARAAQREGIGIRPRSLAVLALAPLAVIAMQVAFNQYYGFRNDLVDPVARSPIGHRLATQWDDHGPAVFREFLVKLFGSQDHFNLILGAFVVVCVITPRRILAGPKMILGAPTALGLIAYAMVYVSTPYDVVWHMDTSLARVLYHLTPAASLCVGASIQSALDRT